MKKNITELIVTTCTYKGKCMGEQLQGWEQFYLSLSCVLREAANNFSKKNLTVHNNGKKLKSTCNIRSEQCPIIAECSIMN